MTLKEMWDIVREIRGGRETKVEIALWIFDHDHDNVIKLKFWDGKHHHEVKSLDDIVRVAEMSVMLPISGAELDWELPDKEKADEGTN